MSRDAVFLVFLGSFLDGFRALLVDLPDLKKLNNFRLGKNSESVHA